MTRMELEAPVARPDTLAQNNPRGYRLRLIGLVPLGCGYLAGTVGLLTARLLAAALSVIFLELLAVKLVIPLAIFIWVVLRALWGRIAPPAGFAVTARTAPALLLRTDQLRRALKAPRVHLFAAALLLSCAGASAHQLTLSSSDTVRLGSKVISAGDKRARVIDAGGEPDYVRTVYTGPDKTDVAGEIVVYRNGMNKHTVIAIGIDDKVRWVADVIGQVGAREAAERWQP